MPTPGGAVSNLPGVMWHFQAWYCDMAPVGSTSTFTGGLSVTLE